MIDDTLAVGGGPADVVVCVVGVALEVFAGWETGVEVADAFVVGDEVDAFADPLGHGGIAVEFDQPPPFAIAGSVDPEVTSASAAIAFPVRDVDDVTSDDHATFAFFLWAVGDTARQAGWEGCW